MVDFWTLSFGRRLSTIALVALVFVGLLVPSLAHQALVPCSGTDVDRVTNNEGQIETTQKNPCTFAHLLYVPASLFNWLISLSVFVLMLMLVWAGIQMLIFYLSEAPEAQLESAKNTFSRAIFGFLIVIGAYLIVNTLLYAILGLSQGSFVGGLLQFLGL